MYSHFRRSQETFTFACENVDNFSPAARQNFIQEIFCNRINELAPRPTHWPVVPSLFRQMPLTSAK